jgi:hypothetical protein
LPTLAAIVRRQAERLPYNGCKTRTGQKNGFKLSNGTRKAHPSLDISLRDEMSRLQIA